MKHTYYKCECNEVSCQFCNGGLGLCTVCGGFEGTLPTDCPGEKISEQNLNLIYEGQLDFRKDRKWIKPDGTGVSMGDYRIAAEERKRKRAESEQSS